MTKLAGDMIVNSAARCDEMVRQVRALFAEHGYVEFEWHAGKQRTMTQNRALHLWFRWLAETLNDAGYDMRRTLKPEAEIPWTAASVKEHLWRPVQQAMLDKQSTADADRLEYTAVADVISRHLSAKLGITAPPWPKKEDKREDE